MSGTPHYTGATVRLLRSDERRVPTDEPRTPLVIEAQRARDLRFLSEWLETWSAELVADVAVHGAVLLRGFDVRAAGDFERVVLGIRGMHGLNEVFMSEPGRVVVPGTRFVLFTNANYKTGGTLDPPMFHHENYYVPDVPRFVSFCCLRPSWLGGETGLVNLAGLYTDLPPHVRTALERQACRVREYPLPEIAQRYGIAADAVRDFCERVGLPIEVRDGVARAAIYKPSVIEHPETGERALALNVGGELNRLDLERLAQAAFAGDYASARWLIHRFHWRSPTVIRELSLLSGLVLRPRQAWPYLGFRITRAFQRLRSHAPAPTSPPSGRAADAFDADAVAQLARSLRRRYSSFLWRPGDVLIVDNLKVAHAGMPGFGPRNLKALICNCVALPQAASAPGLATLGPDQLRECFGAQLSRLALSAYPGSDQMPKRPLEVTDNLERPSGSGAR